MPASALEPLVSRNPATGAVLGRVEATPPGSLPEMAALAREAQGRWAALPWARRREPIRRLWAAIARDAEAWAAAIRDEVGKPTNEAMAEVVASLDAIRWTVKHAGRVLADRRVGPGWQRWLMIGPARVRPVPVGVVGMIGTWNYPLLLNAPPIAQALAAGCGVVWKPSELATLAGERLRRSLEEAGIPEGLVATAFGGPDVGAALVASGVDKGLFTGGVESGRRVLADLASRGVPAVAELSGFDAAVVLPDAPLDATARPLAWGAFVGAGQTCVAVKRAYVVGEPRPLADALAGVARGLRVGNPASAGVDVGPLITEPARERFDRMIRAAIAAGAEPLAGGRPRPGPGWFYEPTVLLARDAAPEAELAGAFGPVVIVRGVRDVEEAVLAANASPFGLAASVWGRDRRLARGVAERLEAGMVAINDAVSPSASAACPFGGVKASGSGRTRGAAGLLEFTQPRTIFSRRPGGLRPQVFPYSTKILGLLAFYRRLFHPRG
jgi:acyl-CoA reductase-like NAD-dependent aldehyde dehydrogenase